jgi:hypothetical protein
MKREHLEKLLVMVRSIRDGDARKGGGAGREVLGEVEAAIVAELDPPPGSFLGLHLDRFAPVGTSAVVVLTAMLSKDLDLCAFSLEGADGATAADRAAAVYRLGLKSVSPASAAKGAL